MRENNHVNRSKFQGGESEVYLYSLSIKIDPGGSLGKNPTQHVEWECVGWLPHPFTHIQECMRK